MMKQVTSGFWANAQQCTYCIAALHRSALAKHLPPAYNMVIERRTPPPSVVRNGSTTSSSSQLSIKFKAWRILLPRQAFRFLRRPFPENQY
jgi:hypothetical protein